MKKWIGFSMMELLIAVIIVAILLAIAIPSYLGYRRRSNRADAIQALLSIQLEQEKYRLNNTTYGDLDAVWGGVTTTDGGNYTLAISSNTATGYTVAASATGDQVGDSEDGNSCNTLTLAYTNGVVTKTPAACWNQ